jgi:hypothetical protein
MSFRALDHFSMYIACVTKRVVHPLCMWNALCMRYQACCAMSRTTSRACVTKRVVHVLLNVLRVRHQGVDAAIRGVAGMVLTSMHQGLAAWTFGRDRSLVCTDLVTSKWRSRTNYIFFYVPSLSILARGLVPAPIVVLAKCDVCKTITLRSVARMFCVQAA